MGEVARAQLTIGADGAAVTIFINYSAPNVRYKFNHNGSYTDITWPCTIVNTNPGGPALKVLFENNVTLSDANSYFICGSANIQFGSTSLQSDGGVPKIFVADSVTDYPGLVQNGIGGLSPVNGNSRISIYNISVNAGDTLANGGGWIGQAANAAIGTYNGSVTPSAATGGTFTAANYSISYTAGNLTVTGFTAGNLVVARYGDGTTTLTNSATALAVVEINPSTGSTVQALSSVSTGANLLSDSGTATSDGYLNTYGTNPALPGYNTALGTASVASLNTKAVNVLGVGATVRWRSTISARREALAVANSAVRC